MSIAPITNRSTIKLQAVAKCRSLLVFFTSHSDSVDVRIHDINPRFVLHLVIITNIKTRRLLQACLLPKFADSYYAEGYPASIDVYGVSSYIESKFCATVIKGVISNSVRFCYRSLSLCIINTVVQCLLH